MIDNLFTAMQALGGLGLFLLGMIIMTEGLREMAGDAIRTALVALLNLALLHIKRKHPKPEGLIVFPAPAPVILVRNAG